MNTMPGYTLLTNIEADQSNIYHKVARGFNLEYAITIHAYDVNGKVVPNYKGFYVKNGTGDLSAFWRVMNREITRLNVRRELFC